MTFVLTSPAKPSFEEMLKRIQDNDPTLTLLNLLGRELADQEAMKVADALKTNDTINTVVLSDNNIGDAGAVALAEALTQHKAVRNVSLSVNNIGPDGIKALEAAQEKNETLKVYLLEQSQQAVSHGTVRFSVPPAIAPQQSTGHQVSQPASLRS